MSPFKFDEGDKVLLSEEAEMPDGTVERVSEPVIVVGRLGRMLGSNWYHVVPADPGIHELRQVVEDVLKDDPKVFPSLNFAEDFSHQPIVSLTKPGTSLTESWICSTVSPSGPASDTAL